MRPRMCCLGEVGHRQFGWLSQLLLCFRGWKVFTQFMSKILDGPFKNHLGFQWRFSIINVSIIPGWPTGLSWRQHFGRFLEMIEKWWWINLGQTSHNIWHITIVYFFAIWSDWWNIVGQFTYLQNLVIFDMTVWKCPGSTTLCWSTSARVCKTSERSRSGNFWWVRSLVGFDNLRDLQCIIGQRQPTYDFICLVWESGWVWECQSNYKYIGGWESISSYDTFTFHSLPSRIFFR